MKMYFDIDKNKEDSATLGKMVNKSRNNTAKEKAVKNYYERTAEILRNWRRF